MTDLCEIVKRLELMPHPEGGYYKETYRSKITVDCNKTHGGERSVCTSIYYLLEGNDFSAWHKVASDEIWYFHTGCDLILYTLDEEGILEKHALGMKASVFQLIVKANTWFCAEPSDKASFSLVSCSVSPGFDFKDFTLATDSELLSKYPQYSEVIKKFIRS